MLNHPTYERLTQLRLTGMAKALVIGHSKIPTYGH
jgi:hypothetical protein